MNLGIDALEETSVHYYIPPPASRRDILYYPLSAGRFFCKPNYHTQRSLYSSFLLIVMLSGSLYFRTLSARGTARAGQVLLLNCYGPHSYGAQGKCAFAFIHFDGAQSKAICAEIERGCGCLFSASHVERLHEAIGGVMDAMREKNRINEVRTSAMIYNILMHLLEADGESGGGTSGNATVDHAVRFIEEHLADKLTVEMIAENAGYSASYFSSVFQRETGMSPYRFLIRARIERAQQLLQTTGASIQDIAFKTGFGSVANFSYAFRKEAGVSPHEFRKRPL